MKTSTLHQRGFAAIAAIFLVLGLATLGAFMVSLSNSQQLSSNQDVQGTRAYWAARFGLEWELGLINALPAGSTACVSTSIVVQGFTVTISCTPLTFVDRNNVTGAIGNINIFQITSTARSAGAVGAVGYVERSVSASLER